MKKYILLFVLAVSLGACEDVIDIELKEGESQLSVDGWLTNKPGKQVIKLRMTANYFDNGSAKAATGAKVTVTDGIGRVFDFVDSKNNGDYEWSPKISDSIPLGMVGNLYTLRIEYKNEVFTAASFMNRVPAIDSLSYTFVEGSTTSVGGYYLGMRAIDIPGEGDLYWFRVSRNDSVVNIPGAINTAYDAAFGPGSDGIQFIPPIEFQLTPKPYYLNDTVVVSCYSIDAATYFFLSEARAQMTNSGLFASPASNVDYNIYNENKDSKVKAVGWFAASAVSELGVRIK